MSVATDTARVGSLVGSPSRKALTIGVALLAFAVAVAAAMLVAPEVGQGPVERTVLEGTDPQQRIPYAVAATGVTAPAIATPTQALDWWEHLTGNTAPVASSLRSYTEGLAELLIQPPRTLLLEPYATYMGNPTNAIWIGSASSFDGFTPFDEIFPTLVTPTPKPPVDTGPRVRIE